MLDHYFFSVFQFYKTKYKSKANDIALLYILLLQGSLLMLLGAFIMLFLGQMHVDVLSTSKAWTLFILLVIILIFRNWIYYTGKNRRILNTKNKKTLIINIWILWLIPFVCFTLSVLVMQRL